jgi:hypothetical protein
MEDSFDEKKKEKFSPSLFVSQCSSQLGKHKNGDIRFFTYLSPSSSLFTTHPKLKAKLGTFAQNIGLIFVTVNLR